MSIFSALFYEARVKYTWFETTVKSDILELHNSVKYNIKYIILKTNTYFSILCCNCSRNF